jgi:hypothetical protein
VTYWLAAAEEVAADAAVVAECVVVVVAECAVAVAAALFVAVVVALDAPWRARRLCLVRRRRGLRWGDLPAAASPVVDGRARVPAVAADRIMETCRRLVVVPAPALDPVVAI